MYSMSMGRVQPGPCHGGVLRYEFDDIGQTSPGHIRLEPCTSGRSTEQFAFDKWVNGDQVTPNRTDTVAQHQCGAPLVAADLECDPALRDVTGLVEEDPPLGPR